MKIRIKIKQVNTGREWLEEYEVKDGQDPEQYARNMIDNFNNTLRHGESPRELLYVEVLEEESFVASNHTWEKQNLYTLKNSKGYYDSYKCIRCGVTGKRYGIGDLIIRDSEYKAKKYDRCGDKNGREV